MSIKKKKWKISRRKTLHSPHAETTGSVGKGHVPSAAGFIPPAQPAQPDPVPALPGTAARAEAPTGCSARPSTRPASPKKDHKTSELRTACQLDFVNRTKSLLERYFSIFFFSLTNIRRCFLKQILAVRRSDVKSASRSGSVGPPYK